MQQERIRYKFHENLLVIQMNLIYFTIFSILALPNTEIFVCRLMWMLLICALNYFNSSYLTLHTVQDLPVHSKYNSASCKSLDLAEIEFTFWQIPQKLIHSCIGNILMYVCTRVGPKVSGLTSKAAPNRKCCEGYIAPSMARLMYQYHYVLK
jgi:hypothetical protein